MRRFSYIIPTFVLLMLSASLARAQSPTFASITACNQKIEAVDKWGQDTHQNLYATDWSDWLEYAYPNTYAELTTDFTGSSVEALAVGTRATDLAAAQSHFAIDFTVSEDCHARLDFDWYGNGDDDASVGQVNIYIYDVTNDVEVMGYLGSTDTLLQDSRTNWVSNIELVTGHQYEFVAHFDALSTDGASPSAQAMGTWAFHLVP